MGNNISSPSQHTDTDRADLESTLKSQSLFSTILSSHHLESASLLPVEKNEGDLEVCQNNDQTVETQPHEDPKTPLNEEEDEEVKSPKEYSPSATNNCDKGSAGDSSAHRSKKGGVSFFNLNSLENPANQAGQMEYSAHFQGDEWKLANIRLDTLLHYVNSRFIWEAHSIVTQKRCTVKINIIESTKLVGNNLTKAEWILKELTGIKHPNVAEVYSFSIWESEYHKIPALVIVIVQELVKCSIRDIQNVYVDKDLSWDQTTVLAILYDVYLGLVTCKEKNLLHGKIQLENVLVSEDMQRAMIADFDLKLPFTDTIKVLSPGKSLFSRYGNLDIPSPHSEKVLAAPDEKDIHDLAVMTLKLVTKDEHVSIGHQLVRKDDRYRRIYHKTFEALDSMIKRMKSPLLILKELETFIEELGGRPQFNLPYSTKRILEKTDTPVDILFTKIDCYELMKNHDAAIEVYGELVKLLETRDIKGPKECEEYVKCVNKTIKHYLSLHNWLKAKDVSNELNRLLKKDDSLKRALKAHPREYISFIFLLANINEELNDGDKAILLYIKGLTYCNRVSIDPELYSSSLKRLSDLYVKKLDFVQALEYLKRLVMFYEKHSEGYYRDKAEAYLSMGNLHIEQEEIVSAVKMYLKTLENLKKAKLNNDFAVLDVVNKIIDCYRNLNEEQNVLTYMKTSRDLKKNIYGGESQEYLDELKEIGQAQVSKNDYHEALETYRTYYKACSNNEIMREQYAESLILLGDIYLKLNHYDHAGDKYKKYSDVQEALKGKESLEYITAQDKLANIAFRKGEFDEALDIQLACLAFKDNCSNLENTHLIASLRNIGDTYLVNKDFEKALEYHKRCLQCLEKLQNTEDRMFGQECAQILLKIAYDYDKMNNIGQAIEAVSKSLEASGTDHGLEMEDTIKLYEMLNRIKGNEVVELDFSAASLTKCVQHVD